ncbi:hypothetical protein Cgig2_031730 [Carnegiea gigantea]|uniref:ARM repeat superfamily protein n=1 Tax=Carnegiea gigantea TaxID=171969 RepID=A0A9Q1QN72_9CARY|nr:hypothetical protein Cgig2_031730 [Carnegiea gigantea]
MATIPANHFSFKVHQIQLQPTNAHLDKGISVRRRRNLRQPFSCSKANNRHVRFFKPGNCPCRPIRACGDAEANTQNSVFSTTEPSVSGLSNRGDNGTYLPLLIRTLGLDNDLLDREQAVKEQSICMLWNLSADEWHRMKIANSPLLPLLIKFLDDEDIKIVESAGGVLANLALSPSTHSIMVEVGVIPKMSKFLTNEFDGTKVIGQGPQGIKTMLLEGLQQSRVIRKEAKNVLLELAKDDYYKILIVEEGLVLVPLVGSAAYASFKPALYSWPSLPDGTEFRRIPRPSRFGASEALLGLNVEDDSHKIDQSKIDAIDGQARQHFLARIGAIEIDDEKKPQVGCSTSHHHTLLTWKDGVARLVLILGLADETAIARAADAIAGASVTERIRMAFKEAGAVKHLVRLLDHNNTAVRSAAVNALEKLSVSNALSETMKAQGVTPPLVNMVKELKKTEGLMEKFHDGPVSGSRKAAYSSSGGASASSGNTGEMIPLEDLVLRYCPIARLVDILKSGSPTLQAKAASILEFLTMIGPGLETIVATNIGFILRAIFEQKLPEADTDADENDQEPDYARLEDAGLAISAASRLVTRLLDYEHFRDTIDSSRFTTLLRQILKSDIPVHYKDWVAACLVKLNSISGPFENPITTEITLHETIPRLIEQIKTSFSSKAQEAAVVELNRIISEDVVGATQAVAVQGGIFPLVKLLEEGSDRAVEAGLAVLYNLSMDNENHPAILAAGAAPILRRIVLSGRPQWMKALRLLRNLPV